MHVPATMLLLPESPCQRYSQVARQLGVLTLASEWLLQEDLRPSSWMQDYPAQPSPAASHGIDTIMFDRAQSILYGDKQIDTVAICLHTLEWHAQELIAQHYKFTAEEPISHSLPAQLTGTIVIVA